MAQNKTFDEFINQLYYGVDFKMSSIEHVVKILEEKSDQIYYFKSATVIVCKFLLQNSMEKLLEFHICLLSVKAHF